jgi:hypothetical protein
MNAARKEAASVTEDRYMSVPMAARALGKAQATILSLIVRGALVGEVVAGRTVVTRESIEQYQIANPA